MRWRIRRVCRRLDRRGAIISPRVRTQTALATSPISASCRLIVDSGSRSDYLQRLNDTSRAPVSPFRLFTLAANASLARPTRAPALQPTRYFMNSSLAGRKPPTHESARHGSPYSSLPPASTRRRALASLRAQRVAMPAAFLHQRSLTTELNLIIARLCATIDAGISACGRDGQPAQVMRPTAIVAGTLRRVGKTAVGHPQQGAAVPVD